LQRIPWPPGFSFASLCKIYVEYINRKYAGHDPIVVFDGYSSDSSTKDISHVRRSKGAIGPKLKFTEDTSCRSKKELFLANSENKQCFINMLSVKLNESNSKTIHATGDADFLIVKTAVSCAIKRLTFVIGEDTGLIVLLCFHAELKANAIIFKSESKQLGGRKLKVWSIHQTKILLGPDVCRLLPFVHAITGCDTTSRMFGIGKAVALRKLGSNAHFKTQVKIFSKEL